jgi:hypothetical protein
MRHAVFSGVRAGRRAAPESERAGRETRPAFVRSKSTPADLELRHSVPSGERRRTSASRLLGKRPPERRPACKPAARLRHSADEGLR